jgi:hypothetical protein
VTSIAAQGFLTCVARTMIPAVMPGKLLLHLVWQALTACAQCYTSVHSPESSSGTVPRAQMHAALSNMRNIVKRNCRGESGAQKRREVVQCLPRVFNTAVITYTLPATLPVQLLLTDARLQKPGTSV